MISERSSRTYLYLAHVHYPRARLTWPSPISSQSRAPIPGPTRTGLGDILAPPSVQSPSVKRYSSGIGGADNRKRGVELRLEQLQHHWQNGGVTDRRDAWQRRLEYSDAGLAPHLLYQGSLTPA
jgi:hypothetical protein